MMCHHRRRQLTSAVQVFVLYSAAALQLLHCMRDLYFVTSFFVPPPSIQNTWIQTRYCETSQQQQTNGNNEPDLFDYFDPLMSPHAYPNGIGASANTNDAPIKSLVRYDEDEEDKENAAKIPLTDANPSLSLQGDDLGWGSNSRSDFQKKSYQLKKPFGISLPGSNEDDDDDDKGTNPKQVSLDTSAIFDPTLSPHMYTKGFVPEVIIGDDVVNSSNNENVKGNKEEAAIIGILLMDHGSRNAASNERLHELAQLYQQQFATATNIRVVVKAAHMEIASPSIQDGLSALLQENVQEIICHPYFLSPGRHVVEDIPQLVKEAIQTLSISIPVKTTRPIGSETNIMINAINSLVKETSEYLQKK